MENIFTATQKAHLYGICDPWADVLLALLEAKLVLAESPAFAAVVKCSVLGKYKMFSMNLNYFWINEWYTDTQSN